MVVTDEFIRMARQAKASRKGLRSVSAGMPISEVKPEYIAWFCEKFPLTSSVILAAMLEPPTNIGSGSRDVVESESIHGTNSENGTHV